METEGRKDGRMERGREKMVLCFAHLERSYEA